LVAKALSDASSYPSRIREGVRAAVFLNKADDDPARAAATEVAALLSPRYAPVVAGSARSGRGVVLR
jgi:hypothetical protein